jgi:hypothetical protein
MIEFLGISLWRPKVRPNLVSRQLRMTIRMNIQNFLRKVGNMVRIALSSERQDTTAGTRPNRVPYRIPTVCSAHTLKDSSCQVLTFLLLFDGDFGTMELMRNEADVVLVAVAGESFPSRLVVQ